MGGDGARAQRARRFNGYAGFQAPSQEVIAVVWEEGSPGQITAGKLDGGKDFGCASARTARVVSRARGFLA